jgi:hypothetical protein
MMGATAESDHIEAETFSGGDAMMAKEELLPLC